MFKKAIIFVLIQLVYLNAQTFNIAKIDTSAFPLIKAKTFVLGENGSQYKDIKAEDFRIHENGIELSGSLKIECPGAQPDNTVNIVVAVENSQSMKKEVSGKTTVFDWVKDELKYFFNNYQFKDSTKISLFSFNTLASQAVGPTTEKAKLNGGLDGITLEGSTLYDDLFVNKATGAVAALENTPADRHRIIIMITTKKPIGTIGEVAILNSLKLNNCRLFVVNVSMEESNIELNSIALQSGGKYYEANTKEGIRSSLESAKQEIAKNLPICTLSWVSDYACNTPELSRNVTLKFLTQYTEINTNYKMDTTFIARTEYQPAKLDFGPRSLNESTKMNIAVTSRNAPFEITNAYISPSQYYTITDFGGTPPPFTIGKDESRTFTVQFTQKNSLDYRKAYLIFEGGPCASFISIEGGQEYIKLDKPNGGEVYSLCEEIPINWSGVEKYRSVRLFSSTNGGNSWQLIKSDTNGGTMMWQPPQRSNSFRIRATPNASSSYFWLNGYGGTDDDLGASIAMAKNSVGFYVAGTFNDKIKIGNYSLTSAGRSDIFIARFDTDGNCLWAQSAGGPNDEFANGVTVDPNDNVYICGGLMNGAKVGSMVFNTYSQSNPYSCIIKLNSKGLNPSVDLVGSVFPNPETKAWGTRIGLSNGKVYLRGLYTGNIDKESFRVSGDSLQGKPFKNPQVFTAVYDTSLSIESIAKGGQNYSFYSTNKVNSADGFTYNIGSFTGTFESGEFSVKSKGKSDFYLSKYGTKPTGFDVSDTNFSVQGPLLALQRDTVDFGNSLISDSIEITYDTLFCNTGTHPMLIDSVKITGNDMQAFSFVAESKQVLLLPGECHTYPVSFKPFKLGGHNALMTIWAECFNKKSVRLLGRGDCGFKGKEFVDLEKVFIDSVKTINADTVFWNINSIPMEITPKVEGIHASEFSIEPKGKMTLQPGQPLGFKIRFNPKDKGIRNATINYNITDTNCVKFETNLIGEGLDNIIGVAEPYGENFSSVNILPNPAGSTFEIIFGLKSPDYITVTMYNTLGERIAGLLNDNLTSGMYKIAADTPGIPNGLYFIRITGQTTQIIHKLIIRK